MPTKLPRTRENFPNQRLCITGKVMPQTHDWAEEIKWELHKQLSGLVEMTIEFAKANEQQFRKFCEDNKDKY